MLIDSSSTGLSHSWIVMYRDCASFGVWQLPIVRCIALGAVQGSVICHYGGNRWGFEGILLHSRCIESSRCSFRD
jgi:hypothetical protein